MTALWMNLWKSSHAPLTHLLAAFALTAVTHHSRNPENTGHGTSHASHAPWAVTLAPLFSKGARVPHRRPSQPLTTPQPVRYSTPMTTWSPEAKTAALTQLTDGHTLAQVHHDTGIPKQTLSRWAKNEGLDPAALSQAKTMAAVKAKQEQWAELRATVANQAGGTAQRILALVTDALDSGELEVRTIGQAKDAALTMAILVDKAQVLGGEASAITAHVGLREQVAEQAAELAPRLRAVG